MAGLKVLISGGGIAGTAMAFWLSKLGHDITVIERFPSLRTAGLQIDLRSHGIEVLRRMGLEQAFRALSPPEEGMQVVDSSGRRRAYFPANKSGKGPQNFTTDFEIMRGDLCRLIHDATHDSAKYVFGQSIESFEQKDDGVEVRFTDGRTDRFDLLVGADGQGSRTRRMMLGSDAEDAFCPIDGNYMGYFTMSRPIQEGEEYIATWYLAPGGRFVMTRRHSPQQMQAYLGCKTNSQRLNDAHRVDVEGEKEALTEIFRGAGWKTDEILESLKTSDDFYCEHLGIVKLDPWYRGRVVLLGDAAYCPAAGGMGTTSAIVGAYILAGEIGRHCGRPGKEDARGANCQDGLATALKAYDQKFRPFMDQVQERIGKDTFSFFPSSAFGIAALNFVLGVVSFLRLNFVGGMIVSESVKGWELPDYKELFRD